MHRLERKFISRNLIFNKKFVHVHLFQYIESTPKFFFKSFPHILYTISTIV